ncbi:hypothetical protein B0H14DRAFT_3446847 [Mycena olivaceomarginata]|nr:hypothetical protein B0H14DRAFT_3446847 [Mycena olivaceomarginata]
MFNLFSTDPGSRISDSSLRLAHPMLPPLLQECSTIFQSFPCLIHFRIVSIESDSLPAPKIGHFPPLESLNLDEEAFGLLACVTLPHLRRLHCTLELDEDVHTLAEFLARSACLLIDLTLRIRLVTDDSALLQCLEPHPALETLHIEYTYTENVPRTLYVLLQSTTVLPHLRSLSVSEFSVESTTAGVIGMLRARRLPPEAHPRFSSFDLAFTRVPAVASDIYRKSKGN